MRETSAPAGPAVPPETLPPPAVVEAWKKTVEVQQHFNDLELRIRNYALTLLAATYAAAGFALKERIPDLAIGSLELPLASLILIAGLFIWLAFYLMDRWWYHQLLYGAVRHGRFIEQRYRDSLPEIGLTSAIGDASAITIGRSRKREIHTNTKMWLFYLAFAVLLLASAALPVVAKQKPAPGARGPWLHAGERASGRRLTINPAQIVLLEEAAGAGGTATGARIRLVDGTVLDIDVAPDVLEGWLRDPGKRASP